jgi:hypothetical protein
MQNLLSIAPSLSIDPSKTPASQSSLNARTISAEIPFVNSLKRLARRAKAAPADVEASSTIKITISGPSSYVPNIGSGWSPNEYLTLHNAKPVENPLIEHPAIGPQQFKTDRGSKKEDYEEDNLMMISHELKQLDRRRGYRTPHKEHNATSPS